MNPIRALSILLIAGSALFLQACCGPIPAGSRVDDQGRYTVVYAIAPAVQGYNWANLDSTNWSDHEKYEIAQRLRTISDDLIGESAGTGASLVLDDNPRIVVTANRDQQALVAGFIRDLETAFFNHAVIYEAQIVTLDTADAPQKLREIAGLRPHDPAQEAGQFTFSEDQKHRMIGLAAQRHEFPLLVARFPWMARLALSTQMGGPTELVLTGALGSENVPARNLKHEWLRMGYQSVTIEMVYGSANHLDLHKYFAVTPGLTSVFELSPKTPNPEAAHERQYLLLTVRTVKDGESYLQALKRYHTSPRRCNG